MPEDRFPEQLFSQEWNIKQRRGRQRKTWGRVIDDLFVSLGLDKAEWLEDIERGESSLASFLACIDDGFSWYVILISLSLSVNAFFNIS